MQFLSATHEVESKAKTTDQQGVPVSFDVPRMEKAMASEKTDVPQGSSDKELHELILSRAK